MLPSHTSVPHSDKHLPDSQMLTNLGDKTNTNKPRLWRLPVSCIKAPTVRGRIPREAEEILVGSSPTKLSLLQTKKSQLPHVFLRNARKIKRDRVLSAQFWLEVSSLLDRADGGKIKMNKYKEAAMILRQQTRKD